MALAALQEHPRVPHIYFLGYSVDADGIHLARYKVRAICNAPALTNKVELQAFLGLLNFYCAFLPHKAAITEPLHKFWIKILGHHQAAAFQAFKDLLRFNTVLAHFN